MPDLWKGRLRKRRSEPDDESQGPAKKDRVNDYEPWSLRLRPRAQSTGTELTRVAPTASKKAAKSQSLATEKRVAKRAAKSSAAAKAKRIAAKARRAAEKTRRVAEKARRDAEKASQRNAEKARRDAEQSRQREAGKARRDAAKARREAEKEKQREAEIVRRNALLAEAERRRAVARQRLTILRTRARGAFRALVKRHILHGRARRIFRALLWRRLALRSHMRRLLIKLARRVRADRGKTVSVTVEPFTFMLSRDTNEYLTELRPNYRGQAYVRDSAGRYHQQLVEVYLEIPKLSVFGITENIVYWNHEHDAVTDLPMMENSMLIFANEDVENAIKQFRSPLSGVRFADIYENPDCDEYDPMDTVNYAAASDAYIFHKHAGAATRAGATTLDTWLVPLSSRKPPPQQHQSNSEGEVVDSFETREDLRIANACGYDIILELFKGPIEALQKFDERRRDHRSGRYKGLTMTYEGLHTFFHGDAPFDADSLGLTLGQFRSFFEHLSLRLTVFDITGAEIREACFMPLSQNKKINPRHVWVLHHNNHFFELRVGLDSLKLRASVLKAPLELQKMEPDKPLSAHYYISQNETTSVYINCLDELTTLNLKGKSMIRVVCPLEMRVALHEIVTRCDYTPGVTMHANKIKALKLRIDDCVIVLSSPDGARNDRTLMFEDKAEFNMFQTLQTRLMRTVINRDTLSVYNEGLARCFREMPRTPLLCDGVRWRRPTRRVDVRGGECCAAPHGPQACRETRHVRARHVKGAYGRDARDGFRSHLWSLRPLQALRRRALQGLLPLRRAQRAHHARHEGVPAPRQSALPSDWRDGADCARLARRRHRELH